MRLICVYAGTLIWQISLGGTAYDEAYSSLLSLNKTYYISGWSNSIDGLITDNIGYVNSWTAKLRFCNKIYYADLDSDGYVDIYSDTLACELPTGYVFDSTDCNDLNPGIHPTLTDFCNAIDDNCNGLTDEDATFVTYFADVDGDNYGDIFNDSIACFELEGYVINNEDCNDLNAEINPATSEICNDIDENCNIEVDEGLTIYTLYADVDGDTYGNPDAAVDTCIETIAGYVNNSLDCNDTIATIYPGATELCNYLDDDCDGLADENLTYILSYQNNDDDAFGNPLIDSLSCELPAGYVEDNTDCDDTNPDIFPGATEILNGLDDDCDQIADEGLFIENLNNIICSISPNPSFDIINIVSNINSNGLYEIISATGQVVLFGEWDINNTSISIINIPAGVYNLRLLFNDNIAVLSFIKIN